MKLIDEFRKYCDEAESLQPADLYVDKVFIGEDKDFYPFEFSGEDIMMSGKNKFFNYYGFCIMKAAKLAGRDENEIEIFVDLSPEYARVAVVDTARGKLILSYSGKPYYFNWETEAELVAELISVIEIMVEKLK